MSQELIDSICARCGCYKSAHGEDLRCEPVGWTFTDTRTPSTPTDAMIEAVAAAIFSDDDQWAKFPEEYREPYRRNARAAIKAMCAADTRTGVREALVKCRDKFAEYVELHKAKLPANYVPADWRDIQEKIRRNQEMVDLCDQALSIPSSTREA